MKQKIVRRVERLFALADQIEVRLAKARGQVDQLTPSPAPSPANLSRKAPPMNRRRSCWNVSKQTMNPSPIGTLENSPAIYRWGVVRKLNKSRQGRQNTFFSFSVFFRPCGAWSSLHSQTTVETVGYCRLSLTGLRNPRSSATPVVEQEIVRRVEGLFALADQLEERLAKARGLVDQLTASLLARAFAGKLVPQDPTDEPASVLLERLALHTSSGKRIGKHRQESP